MPIKTASKQTQANLQPSLTQEIGTLAKGNRSSPEEKALAKQYREELYEEYASGPWCPRKEDPGAWDTQTRLLRAGR
jgi:hypothetical protein